MWPFRFAMRRRRGLPHMVVYLLSTSPKNGAELMDGVQNITRGWWRPTPGSIYPLLKELTDQGIVKKRDDGRYELTSKGKAEAEGSFGWHRRGPSNVDEMLGQMNSFVSYMEDAKASDSEDMRSRAAVLKGLAKRLSGLAGDDHDETKS